MRLLWMCAFLVVWDACRSDQLQNLLNFVKGGSNPAPSSSGRARGAGARPGGGSGSTPAAGGGARTRQQAALTAAVAPIPFAEPADPTRGTVALDVPQPKRAQVPNVGAGQEHLRRMEAAHSKTRIAGLPAGATQVGGRTVDLKPVERRRPAPLSEIQPPVFLQQEFPSPLNDVNPNLAPLQEPYESTLQPPTAGLRPRPVDIPIHRFAEVGTLDFVGNQFQAGQLQSRGINRISNTVFTGAEESRNRELQAQQQEQLRQLQQQQEELNRQQQRLTQQHQQHLQQRFEKQQQQPQQQHRFQPQPSFQPQQQQQPAVNQGSQNSHFSIPGQHRHRQYADELRLAQEALKNLG